MKLSDILALAKQGYKPSDIKELVALAEPEETSTEKPDTTVVEPETAPEPEPETDKPDGTESEDEPDYKKLYEETQQQLKKAQEKNRKAEHDEPKTPEQVAIEHFNKILR